MRLIYSLGWYLALPAVFLRLLWRSRNNAGYRRGWGQRLGFAPPLADRPVWLHAVSVGETVAAAPLVHAWLARHPHIPVLITSTTPTGAARVAELFGGQVGQSTIPFDTPTAVARFLGRIRPRAGIIMETEIWPNLCLGCASREIPLVLANARLSARSARGYRRAGGLIRRSLAALACVGAQDAITAERFKTLGVPENRVQVTGNLKFETESPPDINRQAASLRETIGPGPVWLAASTHEGEEAIVLRAHATARETIPGLRLLLVPRHPERFESVHQLCTQAGMRVSRRSARFVDGAGADVLLGDSMGELGLFYAAADLAFVGGSLVPVGGHNIIEPAACGCPVVIGPHTFKMPALRKAFENEQALVGVEDGPALAREVSRLMQNDAARKALGQRAQTLLARHRGAGERLLQIVESLVHS